MHAVSIDSLVSVMSLKMSVLLCLLLWSLVEVHSQTEFPYVSFRGETLPNHSYVDRTAVGTNTGDPGNTVRCHTDLNTCCTIPQGPHRGDWYFPADGARLPFPGQGDIHEAREDQRVDIRRRNNANLPSGIYRCDIPTIAVYHETDISLRETVYVGLYATGGKRDFPVSLVVPHTVLLIELYVKVL